MRMLRTRHIQLFLHLRRCNWSQKTKRSVGYSMRRSWRPARSIWHAPKLASVHRHLDLSAHRLCRAVVATGGSGGRYKTRCPGMYLVSLSLSLSLNIGCAVRVWPPQANHARLRGKHDANGSPPEFAPPGTRWQGAVGSHLRMCRVQPAMA